MILYVLVFCELTLIFFLLGILRMKQKQVKKTTMLLQEEQKRSEEISTLFQKMIPMEFCKEFQKGENGNLAEVEPKLIQTVILSFDTLEFKRIMRHMKPSELFPFINLLYKKAVPIIYRFHGVVDRFVGGGFTAFYEEEYENALEAAIAVSNKVSEMKAENELYKGYSIGICYGIAYAGMVGNEKRFSALTISEYTGLASFLQSIAVKYYARIIVTETFLLSIEDAHNKYNVRLLGYIYMESFGKLEKVYDVFDGDRVCIRNQKRKTRSAFEKGTDLFSKEDYIQARRYFIEVLKTNKNDKAAKEYLYLCEKCKNSNEKGKGTVWFEVYR